MIDDNEYGKDQKWIATSLERGEVMFMTLQKQYLEQYGLMIEMRTEQRIKNRATAVVGGFVGSVVGSVLTFLLIKLLSRSMDL